MYLFFTILGIIFTIGFSIVINYIYSIFSINKITKFLNPTDETIFNNISTSIVPILLWSFIELPILGTSYYFTLGLILNIFVTLCVSYIIKYGYTLISTKENSIINIIAICISVIFGYIINYISLLLGRTNSIEYSIIGALIITIFYILIKIFPPKSEFFRGKKE